MNRNLLQTRVYPVNVVTKEIYIGEDYDGREGFPTIKEYFREWHGTKDMTGLYGRHLTPAKWRLVPHSMFRH